MQNGNNGTESNVLATIPNFIGNGEYLAFAGYFACRDERESMWRLSRITMVENNSMAFDYIGTFATRTGVLNYIRENPYS